jgi:hypothetical protein
MLGATILATTGLIAVGVTTEAANASSKDLTATYTHVMKSEHFALYGSMSTHVTRAVKLQYRNHNSGAWTTKYSDTTASNGSFYFDLTTTKTRYWRYYAPATNTLASIKGNSLKVSLVSQKVVSIQVTRKTQCHVGNPSATKDVTFEYRFYPARVGRIVSFGSSHITTQDEEDNTGRVVFKFNPGVATDGTFGAAATAQGYYGSSSQVSKILHYSITQCPIIF